MAEITNKFFDDLSKGASWAAGVSFQRSNPLPLDKYSVFESLDKAIEYATTNAVAYPGQVIAVVNDSVMEVYVLAEMPNEVAEGEEQTYSLGLQEMGGKIDLDEVSISYNDAGLLEISGFKGAANATLPQKKVDAEGNVSIEWVTVDAIVKGDGNTTYTVEPIKKTTDEVEEIIGFKLIPSEGEATTISLDVYTKKEVDTAIAAEATRAQKAESDLNTNLNTLKSRFDTLTEGVDDETLDQIKELADYAKENAGEITGIIEDIETLNGDSTVEGSVDKKIADAITNENLGQYAKTTDVEATYVTKTTAEAESGLRFINQTEIDKLKKLNLDGDDITISGSVNASQVKELYDTVVNIVKGSTTDLNPDAEGDQTGLHIEENAQVNKIEKVVFNGTEATIEGKTATIAGEYYSKTEVDTKVKGASDAAAAAQSVADSAKASAEANASTISATNETVASHTSSIATLDQTTSKNTSDIAALTTTVGGHTDELASLTSTLGSTTAQANANAEAITALQAKDTELNNLINTKANSADVYDKISIDAKLKAITDAAYDDTAVRELITANTTAITDETTRAKAAEKANADNIAILVGTDTGRSVRNIAADEINILIGGVSDTDTIEGITSLIEYVNTNDGNIAVLTKTVEDNTTALETLTGEGEGSIAGMIAAAAPSIATTELAGLVKASTAENKVNVDSNGVMEVNSVNVNKLVQTDSDELILYGGNADMTSKSYQ